MEKLLFTLETADIDNGTELVHVTDLYRAIGDGYLAHLFNEYVMHQTTISQGWRMVYATPRNLKVFLGQMEHTNISPTPTFTPRGETIAAHARLEGNQMIAYLLLAHEIRAYESIRVSPNAYNRPPTRVQITNRSVYLGRAVAEIAKGNDTILPDVAWYLSIALGRDIADMRPIAQAIHREPALIQPIAEVVQAIDLPLDLFLQ